MNKLKIIMLLCLMSQGCSTNSNLPMNQPVSNIQGLAAAPVEDATQYQPISVDDLDNKTLETKDEVLEEPKQADAEPKQDVTNGEIKNMSNVNDFMPKPQSYWM
ncbi:MAG: hypothetical protein QNK26_00115 [Moritella sp.]|uniref:hypothetical protein n=1 Tax=Moritella sp. TaxID=78556 RepID=UPI0029A1B56C|nr:hypothetical protein [Moritella sp.]MDX2318987.1 hypothetical protein [Moritella sp.]